MDDQKRQILQEFDKIVESHTGYVKETKENFKDQFSFKNLKGLLKERKDAFDYKLTRMMNSYGYTNIGLRNKLDNIWEDIAITQPAYKKYIRPLRYIYPVTLVMDLIDDTSLLKMQIWKNYTSDAKEVVEEIIDES